MKSSSNQISLSLIAVLALAFVGCGAAQDRAQTEKTSTNSSGESSSVSGNSELSSAAVEAVLVDSFESLVTQNSTSASLALTSEDKNNMVNDKSVYTRECAVDGDTAKVTITTAMDKSMSVERPKMSMSKSATGASSQTRVWSQSKDGAAVPVLCGANNKAASIDWGGDLAGMKLQLNFERSRSQKMTMTTKNKSWEHSRAFSASGARTVEWGAVDAANSDASIIVREKSIVSSVSRIVNVTKKNGVKEELKLAVKTSDEAPLKVRVERDKASKALKKKTIKSGTVVATHNADGRSESVFSNVVLTFTDKECVGDSGTVETKFYAEGGTEPVKSIKLTIEGGVYTLTDGASGEAIGELAEIGCDAEDFAN